MDHILKLDDLLHESSSDDELEIVGNHHRIKDREIHSQLQSDLVEHLWQIHSQS